MVGPINCSNFSNSINHFHWVDTPGRKTDDPVQHFNYFHLKNFWSL